MLYRLLSVYCEIAALHGRYPGCHPYLYASRGYMPQEAVPYGLEVQSYNLKLKQYAGRALQVPCCRSTTGHYSLHLKISRTHLIDPFQPKNPMRREGSRGCW